MSADSFSVSNLSPFIKKMLKFSEDPRFTWSLAASVSGVCRESVATVTEYLLDEVSE